MLKRIVTGLVMAAALVLGTLAATAGPANAAGGVWCDTSGTGFCYLTLDSAPSDPPYSPDEHGWTAGAPTCYYETSKSGAQQLGYTPDQIRVRDVGGVQYWYVIIDCGTDTTYWSNDRQCYIHMVDGQWPARPGGLSQNAGYYGCVMFQGNPNGPGGPGLGNETFFWSDQIPPGLKVLTPADAAAQIIAGFQLRGIDIGMAPDVNPAWGHRRSYVGVPVWLWVNNPQPLTWGPYSETATLGGQTITATAQVTSVRWDMGDGGSRVCGNTGTPYSSGYGLSDSPTCGYRYTTTSKANAGDRFTVTATSQWSVTWTSNRGATGVINLTTASNTQLQINELQTVNVTPNGSPIP